MKHFRTSMLNNTRSDSGRWRPAVWLLFGWMMGAGSAALAADPVDLSTFLPRPAALYLEVPQPDQAWTAWEASPLRHRADSIGLLELLQRHPTWQRWRKTDSEVAAATKTGLFDHVRGLCGDGLGLAVFVAEQGEPQGLWLSRARSAATIQATLTAWDQVEPAQKTTKQTAAGQTYSVRTVRPGPNERRLFYAIRNEYFALSDHESLVAECADRLAVAPNSTNESPAAIRSRVIPTATSAPVWLICRPRAWDRLLLSEPPREPAEQKLLDVWRAIETLAVSLEMTEGVSVTLAATVDPAAAETSGWSAAVAQRPTQALSVWSIAASDAVVIAGGSMRPAWFLDQFRHLLNEREQREWARGMIVLRGLLLNQDPQDEVAAALLSDWGAWATFRQPNKLPLTATDWSLVSHHRLHDSARAAKAIDEALALSLHAIGIQSNVADPDRPVHVARQEEGSTTSRRLVGRADRDFGYQLSDERLTIGFPAATLTAAAPVETTHRDWLRTTVSSPLLVVWCDLTRVRRAFGLTSMEPVPLQDGRDPRGWGRLFDQVAAVFDGTPTRLELRCVGRINASPDGSKTSPR